MAVTENMMTLAKDILQEIEKSPYYHDIMQSYGCYINSLELLAKGSITDYSKKTLLSMLSKGRISKEKETRLKELIEPSVGGRRRRKAKRTRRHRKAKRHTRRRA